MILSIQNSTSHVSGGMFISPIQPLVLVRTVSHESEIPWIMVVWTTQTEPISILYQNFFFLIGIGGSYFLCGSIIIRRQVPEFREKSQSSSFTLIASHRKRDAHREKQGKRQSPVSGIRQGRWASPSTQESYFLPVQRAILCGGCQKAEQGCNFRRMLNLPRTASCPWGKKEEMATRETEKAFSALYGISQTQLFHLKYILFYFSGFSVETNSVGHSLFHWPCKMSYKIFDWQMWERREYSVNHLQENQRQERVYKHLTLRIPKIWINKYLRLWPVFRPLA